MFLKIKSSTAPSSRKMDTYIEECGRTNRCAAYVLWYECVLASQQLFFFSATS